MTDYSQLDADELRDLWKMQYKYDILLSHAHQELDDPMLGTFISSVAANGDELDDAVRSKLGEAEYESLREEVEEWREEEGY